MLILLGSFFTVVGALGLVRMPEVFTRMHAASVTDTLGVGFLILGMGLQAGLSLVTLKLFFLMLLLFVFTGPVVTHALAQACSARRDRARCWRKTVAMHIRRTDADEGRQP